MGMSRPRTPLHPTGAHRVLPRTQDTPAQPQPLRHARCRDSCMEHHDAGPCVCEDGPAIVLGFIQPPPPGNWVGTQVALGDGQTALKMGLPVPFIEYLMDRAARVLASERARSARQQDKINRALEANEARAAASESIRAMDADVRMFGVEQVSPEDNPRPRREPSLKPPRPAATSSVPRTATGCAGVPPAMPPGSMSG